MRVLITLISALSLSACAAVTAPNFSAKKLTAQKLAAFEQTLAANPSATRALATWCQAQDLASPATITAKTLHGDDAPAPADLTRLLAIKANEAATYRHVALHCGTSILSVAHNWYNPALLTPAMNEALTTTTPFGSVVAPLHFTRQKLDSHHGPSPQCPAGTILSHRALLRLPDSRPLALLVECYTAANIAQPNG